MAKNVYERDPEVATACVEDCDRRPEEKKGRTGIDEHENLRCEETLPITNRNSNECKSKIIPGKKVDVPLDVLDGGSPGVKGNDQQQKESQAILVLDKNELPRYKPSLHITNRNDLSHRSAISIEDIPRDGFDDASSMDSHNNLHNKRQASLQIGVNEQERCQQNFQDVSSLLSENHKLKQMMNFTICKNNQFQFVLVECGHVVCANCAFQSRCICGKKIMGRHRCILSQPC